MNALYILCGLGVFALVAELTHLKRWLIPVLIGGIAVAALYLFRDWGTTMHYFNDMVVFDDTAISFSVLVCVVSLLWFWMSASYFHQETHVTDQASLVLFVIVGAVILTAFNNMSMLFLGIEILSLSLYVLAGSRKDSLLSNEAAFKYFLMGSFATGFLLMGIALIYGATGFFHLDKIATYIAAHPNNMPGFFYAGILLVIVGMSFKISAVPFHFWAPDVYEGSPTVITALMATVVKVGAFAAFYRLVLYCFAPVESSWHFTVQIITVSTMVLANVTAVYQTQVKRMLAYSSVGHAGYILLALISGGVSSAGTILYYLTAYSIATLTAFTVLARIEFRGGTSNANIFDGLYRRSPFLAVAMTVALLSLAGIPPLAGFLGKYLVFAMALQRGYGNLVLLGVVTSLVGVYYYFRVMLSMYSGGGSAGSLSISLSTKLLLWVLIALNLGLGIFPNLVFGL
jgi:NADH-quinone oxidoreductase subunit N